MSRMYPGYGVGVSGKLSTQVISPLFRLSACKIWGIWCKGNVVKFGVEWCGLGKVCNFQWKTGHILKTVRDRAKVAIVTNRKSHATFQMK